MNAQVFVLDHDPTGLGKRLRHVQRLLEILRRRRQALTQILFLAVLRDRQAVDRADVDARVALDAQLRGEHGLDVAVQAALDFLHGLAGRAGAYNGFSLVVGDRQRLAWLSNRGPGPAEIPPGVHGLSNHLLDTPWPKLVSSRERLRGLLGLEEVEPEQLLGLLAARDLPPDEQLPDTGVGLELERMLNASGVTKGHVIRPSDYETPKRIIFIQCVKVLAHRTAITPIVIVVPMTLAAGIGFHDARIDGKTFTLNKVCIDAVL